jgi:hypothetical protein
MKAVVAALLLGAFFGLCAVVGGETWYLIGFSYALLWPLMFAFAILPGVLIGSHMRTWQSCVVLTEIVTFVAATTLDHPTLEQLFQPSFGMQLAMVHLALFPPVLLSLLIGYFGRKQREHGDQESV